MFNHNSNRETPDTRTSREEYLDLMDLVRPVASATLGVRKKRNLSPLKRILILDLQPSLLSRVTSVLPFIPFTTNEKMAIAMEALYSLPGGMGKNISGQDAVALTRKALKIYHPAEGARSLYRAIASQMVYAC